jgi:hypothetical protein
MTSGEMYFVTLVIGAFSVFALALAANALQYRAWVTRTSGR